MSQDGNRESIAELKRLVKILTEREIELTKAKEELEELNMKLEEKVEERTLQLEDAQEQLIQSAKMATIGTLAGGIAHEINNPLGAILTNTQMLLIEVKDEEQKKSLKLIEEGTRRCRDIVTALLKYSRKAALDEFRPVNLNDIIEDACNLLQHQLDEENVRIKMECSRIPEIMGNSNELQQVFTNLMLNSRDAIKKIRDEGEIIIKTYPVNGSIVIEVADNGCGIEKDKIGRIFDPFYTTKDVGEGTGLGLSIAYKVIEKHNGSINVSSKNSKGTTFTIKLEVG